LLTEALSRLGRRFGPLLVAPVYRSQPVASLPQPDYFNTVALGATREPPEALLAGALEVERDLGRVRDGRRAAPRCLDIDLLFVGDEERRSAELVLPHPRLRERRFVLAPLADVAPDLPMPPDGATPRTLLARLPELPWVRRLGAPEGA
jgi:2-amino-4-hydroxy-6-hydroxymethyldihydropteridine diphosphokinase